VSAPSYDRGVVRVLAVSDEVDDALVADPTPAGRAELILACGDLPFEYLDSLMNVLDIPLVFVPGNHDPDVCCSPTRHPAASVTVTTRRTGGSGRCPGWSPRSSPQRCCTVTCIPTARPSGGIGWAAPRCAT